VNGRFSVAFGCMTTFIVFIVVLAVYEKASLFQARRIVESHCNENYPTIISNEKWQKYQAYRRENQIPDNLYSIKFISRFPKSFFDLPYSSVIYRLYEKDQPIAELVRYRLYKYGPVMSAFPNGRPSALDCPDSSSERFRRLSNEFEPTS
jgi:hypothetical protein